MDLNGNTNLYRIYAADVRGSIYYDRDDTTFYLDPAGTSITNHMRATIYYDRDNTGYYVNPNSLSNIYDINVNSRMDIGLTTGQSNHRLEIRGFGTGTNSFGIVVRNSSGTNNMWVRDDGTGWLRAASWAYGSDRRLKENISNMNYGLDTVLQLNPQKFDYIDGAKEQLGFIAQDVESIIPELVSTNKEDGMLSLSTGMLIPVLTSAIQEQNQLITTNSNNITLSATATSVSQLQTLVEQEFTSTTEILNQVQNDILDMQEEANDNADIIEELQLTLQSMQSGISLLNAMGATDIEKLTNLLAINPDELLIAKIEDDNRILTFDGIMNVDKIIVGEIEIEKLSVIENSDEAMVGRWVICPVEESYDEDLLKCVFDDNANGKKVFVKTEVAGDDSHIFVTPKGDASQILSVKEIIEGEGFVVESKSEVEDEIIFDWFIVKGV
jgi:hypothetical protein